MSILTFLVAGMLATSINDTHGFWWAAAIYLAIIIARYLFAPSWYSMLVLDREHCLPPWKTKKDRLRTENY